MTQPKQIFLNLFQRVFHFVWTPFWISAALIVMILTLSNKISLKMAHWIWAPGILWNTRTKLDIHGLENVDFSKPHIFVMNHQSTLDIPIIFKIVPVPLRFIVKKELKYIPFLGWYIWAMGMITVDRKNRNKAINSLKKAGKIIRNGASIIAYPEGTRSESGEIQSFKKGVFIVAIEAGVPIVPVVVEGSRLAMPKNTFNPVPQTVKIQIGKPIPTSQLSQDDRDLLLNKIRNAMIDMHKSIGGKGGIKIPQEIIKMSA